MYIQPNPAVYPLGAPLIESNWRAAWRNSRNKVASLPVVFADKALLVDGWADDVRLDVRDGIVAAVETGVEPASGDTAVGIVLPGLANAHSHAFQRALAGHTEARSPAGRDNFWSWRERMYALAASIDAAALQAIARQVYAEMLAAGYTAVAEFHYLHRQAGAAAPDDSMFEALRRAAEETGIRLTYVPVLYERAGFDADTPDERQRGFVLSLDEFLDHHAAAAAQAGGLVNVGIGAHSLRAVSEASLHSIAAARNGDMPLHIHIAEQQREVEQCLATLGRRPVRWLMEQFEVDEHWCLVHATHMDFDEVERLAASKAVVCLCPSTEATLGDGLFPLADYLAAGGRIAIGSDSHVSINPYEELRWLEYGQRLASRSRNVAALRDSHVGSELYRRALAGGAQALGGIRRGDSQPDDIQQGVRQGDIQQGDLQQRERHRGAARRDDIPRGGIHQRDSHVGGAQAGLAVGSPADLVSFYTDDAMFSGHGDASRLDALVFSGYRLPIDRVMVAGVWRVVDGLHVEREPTRRAFAAALERIGVQP